MPTGAQRADADDGTVDITPPVLGPPINWTGTRARTSGAVLIPDHVDPTNPRRVYELENRAECKYLYEIVLTDGNASDIDRIIDHALLVELWDRLYLPDDVRTAWALALTLSPDQEAAGTSTTLSRTGLGRRTCEVVYGNN